MDAAALEHLLDDPIPYLDDDEPAVRRLALAACHGRIAEPVVRRIAEDRLASDRDAAVRAAAAELLAEAGSATIELLLEARLDPDARVVEAVATGLGEIADRRALPWLVEAAQHHDDRLVREAAVAALGEIGDPEAVATLLDLLRQAPPQVRRRAVVALTVFDDSRVEPALREARNDRNPMVREVAEMVVGGEMAPNWEPVGSPHPTRS